MSEEADAGLAQWDRDITISAARCLLQSWSRGSSHRSRPTLAKRPVRRWVDHCALSSSSGDTGSSGSGDSCISSDDDSEEDQASPSDDDEASPMIAPPRQRELQPRVSAINTLSGACSVEDGNLIRRVDQAPRATVGLSAASRLPVIHEDTVATGRSTRDGRTNPSDDSQIALRVLSWCLQLHGCLCEAPLAVIEGLTRAPCYLIAAVWVAVVAQVEAAGDAREDERLRLMGRARALAREAVLLFLASLTLAVPCSTCFTVYADATSVAGAWDARPVPTLLGGVDPLRFFVFANGQVAEFARNGRSDRTLSVPIALRPEGHDASPAIGSFRASSSPSLASPHSPDGVLDSRSRVRPPSQPGSCKHAGRDVHGPCCSTAASRRAGCCDSSCHRHPVVAQSMDTDRLGVGMLHPPHHVELQWRQALTGAWQTVARATTRAVATSRSASGASI